MPFNEASEVAEVVKTFVHPYLPPARKAPTVEIRFTPSLALRHLPAAGKIAPNQPSSDARLPPPDADDALPTIDAGWRHPALGRGETIRVRRDLWFLP